MKENIEYYYNIQIEDLNDDNNRFSFVYLNNEYIFVQFNRDIGELDSIIKTSSELKIKNISTMDIIYNRNREVLTNIDEINYILLKVPVNYQDEIDLNDIINYNNKTILTMQSSKLYRNNWAYLWSLKMDYFEYQIRELGKNKSIILDSFSYYLGLAENAISLVNDAGVRHINDAQICLEHRRIYYPNYKLNYANPLSYIFDISVRDYAEYIKSCFFSDKDAYLEFQILLKSKKMTNYEAQMFMARLIYPSYYFDLYEKIMNSEETENILISVIKKVDSYEKFLKYVYIEILKYNNIDKVEWLFKN